MVDSMVDEALDNYVKATGRDGTQKREELVNMRPGELRRSLEHWQARAKEVQRLQDKKEHAWNLYSRVPNFRFRNKENFEGDFKHRAVYDGKVDERKLQEWIDEMQPKVRVAERQLETRERKWMETEDSNSQRRRALEKVARDEGRRAAGFVETGGIQVRQVRHEEGRHERAAEIENRASHEPHGLRVHENRDKRVEVSIGENMMALQIAVLAVGS